MANENSVLKVWLLSLSRLTLLFLVACTTGQCKQDGTKVENPVLEKPSRHEDLQEGTARVAKPDGSKQCGISPGVSAQEMSAQLKGINIVSSEKRSDGLMRIQACGTPTGMHNIYEISVKDIDKAKERGFKLFKR